MTLPSFISGSTPAARDGQVVVLTVTVLVLMIVLENWLWKRRERKQAARIEAQALADRVTDALERASLKWKAGTLTRVDREELARLYD